MAQVIGPPANVIRNRAIAQVLKDLLSEAADATGIEKVVVVSGGQTSNHAPNLKGVVGGWTGSRRHDNGRAADIELIRNGKTLSFTDTDGSQVDDFVTSAAARGATGIGAGVNYMGPRRLHVGFGNSITDVQKLTWGAAGASANAPAWLRTAAAQGWNNPVGADLVAALSFPASSLPPYSVRHSARSTVSARDGLWLRKGPGLSFDRARLLDAGMELMVLGVDGDWARVDLQGDGLVDGHVLAAFLEPGDTNARDDGEEEPVHAEAVAELLAETGADDATASRTRAGSRASRSSARRSEA